MLQLSATLARIRIPIPPHLVDPVLKGLSVVLIVLAVLLFISLLHAIVTQSKTIFGPGSRIKMTGIELIKELVSFGFWAVACLALSLFSFMQTTWYKTEQPSEPQTIKYETQSPHRYIPSLPSRSGRAKND